MELNCHIVIAVASNLHVQGLKSVEFRPGELPKSYTRVRLTRAQAVEISKLRRDTRTFEGTGVL